MSDRSNSRIAPTQSVDASTIFDDSNIGQSLVLPDKVYHVIRSRLSRLSPSAYQLAGLAASIGKSFHYQVLAQASEIDKNELMISLDELWRRRIIREQSATSSDHAYDFSHDRIRDVAYSELSVIRRQHYHRTIAKALERVYTNDIAEWSAQIAHHYEQAGIHAQASDYYRMAGTRAAGQFAHAEALVYFAQALELIEAADTVKRFELHALRERAYHVQTSRDAQQQELDAMMALADRLQNQEKHATVLLRHAERAEGLGDYKGAIKFANQAVQLAGNAGDRRQEGQGAMQLGSVFWNQGDYLQSEAQFLQALQIGQDIGDRTMEATVLLHLGALITYFGDYQKAKQISQRALDAALDLGNTEGEIWAHNQLGFQIVEQGNDDLAEAKSHLTRGLDLAKKMGHRAYIAKLSSNLATTYDRLGEYQAALDRLDESLAIAEETGSARHKAFALGHRGNTLANLGTFEEAQAQFEQALTLFQQIGYRQGEGKTLSELGLLHIWLGDHDRALQLTDQALDIARKINIQRDQAYSLTRKGYAYEGLSDWRSASETYEQALALYRLTGQQNRSLEPSAGLVRIASVLGDLDRAINLARPILAHMQTRALNATNEAFWVYVTCWQTFQSVDDPRMPDVLNHVHTILNQRVSKLFPQLENGTVPPAFGTLLERTLRYHTSN